MDANARRNYRVALKQAEAELAAHEQRGGALRAAVEGLGRLVAADAPPPRSPAPAKRRKRKRRSAGAGHPDVAKGTFEGIGPTDAYHKFTEMYGDNYTPPQIRDALIQGGVKSKSPKSVITVIYQIRDQLKAKEAENRRKAEESDAA